MNNKDLDRLSKYYSDSIESYQKKSDQRRQSVEDMIKNTMESLVYISKIIDNNNQENNFDGVVEVYENEIQYRMNDKLLKVSIQDNHTSALLLIQGTIVDYDPDNSFNYKEINNTNINKKLYMKIDDTTKGIEYVDGNKDIYYTNFSMMKYILNIIATLSIFGYDTPVPETKAEE